MGSDTKVNISLDELIVLMDTKFLSTKQVLTDKIYQLFGDFSQAIKSDEKYSQFPFPEGMDTETGKISKGEQYQGLPYIILDLPRLFSNDSIFAFRTLLWWGHYFTFTLHLDGQALERYRNALLQHLPQLREDGLYFCVNTEEWEHHLEADNYLPLADMDKGDLEAAIKNRPFIKVARKLELKDYDHLISRGLETLHLYLHLLEEK